MVELNAICYGYHNPITLEYYSILATKKDFDSVNYDNYIVEDNYKHILGKFNSFIQAQTFLNRYDEERNKEKKHE